MSPRRVITGLALLGAMTAVPAVAGDAQRGRPRSDRRGESRQVDRGGPRAVPRSPYATRPYQQPRQYDVRRDDDRRRAELRAPYVGRSYQGPQQYEVRRYDPVRRAVPRSPYVARSYGRPYQPYHFGYRTRADGGPYAYPNRGYYNRGYYNGGYYNRGYYNRGYYNRGYYYRPRGYFPARLIRPYIVTILPYQPYFYRPSLSVGIYYGTGGGYPYGYVPRSYYDPIPGRIYGGVRIIHAPRDAQVFADGHFVGIVDDFDGDFQHVNLEAGEHRIEIQQPGFDPIAFDVFVQPGRTITLRAYPY